MLGVCAHGGCVDVNVSGSVCDVCAWGWLCTAAVAVAVTVVVAAAAEDEGENEACARCSRHGTLDRSSMISSSPSSTTHHPPADREVNASVSCIPPSSVGPSSATAQVDREVIKSSARLLKVIKGRRDGLSLSRVHSVDNCVFKVVSV